MHTLPLSPLPSETREESTESQRIVSEGFIDEQEVTLLIARGAYDRSTAQPAGMVLSASGDDYAGWMLPVKSPFRKMAMQPASMAPQRLPLPPALRKNAEPGLDMPHEGGHRWWLFGMSGAMTCCILALTLFSLAQRQGVSGLAFSPVPAADKSEIPQAAENVPAVPPTLTTVLPAER